MGDIKRIRKKYQTPMHPWNKERIDTERRYRRQFGLTNKKELWKAESTLKGFKDQIKSFPSMSEENAAKQSKLLRKRLMKFGLIDETSPMGTILGLDTEAILNRRLQTIVHKKGLARTVKQARQLITHEHITVNGITVNAPSYLVTTADESSVQFHPSSAMAQETHPERAPKEGQVKPKDVPKKQSAEEEPEVVELTEEDLDE